MKNFLAIFISILVTFGAIPTMESAEVKVTIPFGTGSKPKKDNIIEKLKNEETKGAGAAIGLIVLGACIVAAAILIVNKADDVVNKTQDKYDSEKEYVEERYENETEENENSE